MQYQRLTSALILSLVFFVHCCSCTAVPAGLNVTESFWRRLKRQAEGDEDATEAPEDNPEAEPGNANKFVDDLFSDNQKLFVERGLDPFQIGAIEICTDCVLAGLSSIRRTGDATLKQEPSGDIVVDITVGFGLIRGSCHCVKKLLLVSLSGVVRMMLRNLNVHATVRVTITPDAKFVPAMDAFEVTDQGKLDIYWEGRGILGSIVEPFFNLFRVKIASTVQRFLPSVLKAAITQNIGKAADFIKF